jgi:uncharacterized heparinase superfamily protein
MSLFNLKEVPFGDPPQWNFEAEAGIPTPMGPAHRIDYRDHSETGDCKFAWEPSRHGHLGVLARAYRLSGETRFASKVIEHISTWIEQCPFGQGMNWRSPLELSIRLINWTWALRLVRPALEEVLDARTGAWILASVHQHLREVARKYSKYSSANNHLIGEAAGVFVASNWFHILEGSAELSREARVLLEEEMANQVTADGAHVELATGYHLFVLEFFLYAAIIAREAGQPFSEAYHQGLRRMFSYVAGLHEGGELPMLNDADDGYVLDLHEGADRSRALLAVGAALFECPVMKAESRRFSDTAWWLLGDKGRTSFENSCLSTEALSCRAYKDAGHYLLQCGDRGADDRISVLFDCGPLGYGSIAAHGHADASSFTLRVGGKDVLVDPGTFDYFSFPAWRNYFRSTKAHNTVVVENADQSEMLGLFLWGHRATAQCTAWEISPSVSRVAGTHDGYQRKGFVAVQHARELQLDAENHRVVITDRLCAKQAGSWRIEMPFHFAEHCEVRADGGQGFAITWDGGHMRLTLAEGLATELIKGPQEPPYGWVSRGYHDKQPAPCLVARGTVTQDTTLVTTLEMD